MNPLRPWHWQALACGSAALLGFLLALNPNARQPAPAANRPQPYPTPQTTTSPPAAPAEETQRDDAPETTRLLTGDFRARAEGALARQREIRFSSAETFARFLERAAGRIEILDSQDALRAVRVRFGTLQDLESLLDGSEQSGLVFPVIPPDPRGGDVQENAVPLRKGLLRWLGVDHAEPDWGKGVKIAVLDTGVAPHATFPREVPNVLLMPTEKPPDAWYGHGTAVTSLIVGQLREAPGVAPGADVTSYRVSDDKGRSDTWTLAVAIRRAVDEGNRILSISMGSYGDSSLLREAVSYALNAGVVIVASSGNEGYEKPTFPAAYGGVVKAVAVDAQGDPLLFSNRADASALAAPGWAVNAAYPQDSIVEFSGTSASAPILSGALAAVMTQATPGTTLHPYEALQLLYAYANEAGSAGPDSATGSGAVNLARIFERNTPNLPDAAVASQVFHPPADGTVPSVEVNIQNRGTQTLLTLPVQISTPANVSQFSIPVLEPGKVHTLRVPVPAPLFGTGFTLSAHTQILRADRNPQNNGRSNTYLAPKAPSP